MKFIKCSDQKTKELLIQQGFKLVGTECINDRKIYLFTNPKEIRLTNKNIFQSNKLYF